MIEFEPKNLIKQKHPMKTIKLLLVFSAFFLLSTCSKDENEIINISGITQRDYMGNLIGSADSDDWGINDVWPSSVEALFQKTNQQKSAATIIDLSNLAGAGYPNPAKDIICFNFPMPSQYYCDLRIVDSQLNILSQLDSVQNCISLQFHSAFTKNKLYRIYYKTYATDKVVYRGHGDFKFIN